MKVVDSRQLLLPLVQWLEDEGVREIMFNKPGECYIENNSGMTRVQAAGLNALYVMRMLQLIANESKLIMDDLNPVLATNLYDGSRIQAVLPPISLNPCFSIRKHLNNPLPLEDLLGNHNLHVIGQNRLTNRDDAQSLIDKKNWLGFFKWAIRYRYNILIAGETGSGKTTLLNSILCKVPLLERMIILEDTREINVRKRNILSLLTRTERVQTGEAITMSELVRIALRLRPDRIILGELRGGEAYDFIAACETGHGGSMTTIHAGSPDIAIDRLLQLTLLKSQVSCPAEMVRKRIEKVIDVVVHLGRRKSGAHMKEVVLL